MYDIRFKGRPTLIRPKEFPAVTLTGPLLDNTRMRFESPLVNLTREWVAKDDEPDHGIKLSGIEVQDCEELPPPYFSAFPSTNLFSLRLLIKNDSDNTPVAVHRAYARIYDADCCGKVDLTASEVCEWRSIGTPRWMTPKQEMLYDEPGLFEARTKTIQLIALMLSKEDPKIAGGKGYKVLTHPALVPFSYILERNSSFGETPNWSLYKAEGPK